MEDLQLHQALLESLLESRSDAIEDRIELESTITDLQRQLAHRRGVARPLPPQPHRVERLMPQYDGAADDRMPNLPPEYGAGGFAAGFEPLDHTNQLPDFFVQPEFSHSTPHQNHTNPAHPYNHPTSANIMSSLGSVPSTPGAASTHSFNHAYDDLDNDLDDDLVGDAMDDDETQLHRLLGLDDPDSFSEGQHEAEDWLRSRLEQERQDEDLARRLQEQWNQPSPSFSNNSPPPPTSARLKKPSGPTNPQARAMDSFSTSQCQPPSYGDSQKVPSSHNSAVHPGRGVLPLHLRQPSYAPSPFTSRESKETVGLPLWSRSVPIVNDSSDSDITEISPQDFQASTSTASSSGRFQTYASTRFDDSRNRHTMYPPDWPSTIVESNRSAITPQGSSAIIRNAFNKAMSSAKSLGGIDLSMIGPGGEEAVLRSSLFPSLSHDGFVIRSLFAS